MTNPPPDRLTPAPPSPRDEDLLAYQESGDTEALARFFVALSPRLLLVAAHAVRSTADAEDLVQSTFVDAMSSVQSYQRQGSATSWVMSILRHQILDRHRSDSRAQVHLEDEVAERLAEGTPTGIEVLMSGELWQQVQDAVANLPEPYRSVIDLRVLRGLSPNDVAQELDIKGSTARMQIKRGLERLRDMLPSSTGLLTVGAVAILSDASGLSSTALAEGACRGTVPATATRPRSGFTLTSPGTVGTVALLLVALASLLLSHLAADANRPATIAQIDLGNQPATLRAADDALPRPEFDRTLRVPALPTSPETDASTVAPVRISGRILTPDGAPARGRVEWTYEPLHFGFPHQPNSIHGTTDQLDLDAGGYFRIRSDEDTPHSIRIHVQADTAPPFALHVPLVPAQRGIDLGDLVVASACALRGRIVDEQGQLPRPMPSFVEAHYEWHPLHDLRPPDGGRQRVPVNIDGSFRFEQLPLEAGRVELQAGDSSLQVPDGHTAPVDLVIPGSDSGQKIVVDILSQGQVLVPETFITLEDSVWIEDSLGNRVPPTSHEVNTLEWHLEPEAGQFICVQADGFAEVRQPVAPADPRQRVTVAGTNTLRLRVLDGNGAPVTQLWAQFTPISPVSGERGRTYTSPSQVDLDGWAIFEGLPSLDTQVSILDDHRVLTSFELLDLKPHETRHRTVDLRAQLAIEGLVLDARGNPASGVPIEARREGSGFRRFDQVGPLTPEDLGSHKPTTLSVYATTTDDLGRFRLPVPTGTTYAVLAHRSAWIYALQEGTSPGEMAELRLPPSRTMRGQLTGLSPGSLAALDLEIDADGTRPLPGAPLQAPGHRWRAGPRGLLREDGSFGPVEVPTTPFDLQIIYPHIEFGPPPSMRIAGPMLTATRVPPGQEAIRLDPLPIDDLGPGRLSLELADPSSSPSPVTLRGVAQERHGEERQRRTTSRQLTISSADDPVEIDWIPSGTWTLTISSPAFGWTITADDVASVAPGETASTSFSTPFPTSRVRVHAEDLLPLRNARVEVQHRAADGSSSRSKTLTTDAQGWLELTFPPGEVDLSYTPTPPQLATASTTNGDPRQTAPRVATLRWTPAGPDRTEVTLD